MVGIEPIIPHASRGQNQASLGPMKIPQSHEKQGFSDLTVKPPREGARQSVLGPPTFKRHSTYLVIGNMTGAIFQAKGRQDPEIISMIQSYEWLQ